MKAYFILLFLAGSGFGAAQEPAAAKDPFVKGKTEVAEKPAEGAWDGRMIWSQLETITLPQKEYAAWLDAPETAGGLYEKALAAVKSGTAKLDGCHALSAVDSTRATIEAVDELIYPTEWTPADKTGFQYPSMFETRRIGDRLEMESVLPKDAGPVTVSHAFVRERFLGFNAVKADTTLPGIPVAAFTGEQSPGQCRALPGVPLLINTLTKEQTPGVITLLFGTFRTYVVAPSPKPRPKGEGNLRITARVISLDRAQGGELLKRHATESAACLAELKAMVGAETAVLEHVSTILTPSSMRAVHQSGPSYAYGVEFYPPADNHMVVGDAAKGVMPTPAGATASTSQTETRNLGYRWEIESTYIEERGMVSSTLAFSHTSLDGPLKDKALPERYPEIPLFREQKVVTGVEQAVNSTLLVGSLNPPGDTGANGHQDEQRLWLLFLDIHLE